MKKNYNTIKKLIKNIIEETHNICIQGSLNIYNKLENQARINYEKYKTLEKIINTNDIKIPKKIKNDIIDFIKYFE